jgi:uncharacterized membrane protein
MNRLPTYETWPRTPQHLVVMPVGQTVFDAHIKPHRSLPNIGFYVLMGAVCAISFTAGIVFLTIGAWPILGFFGLDILLIWLAFKFSYKSGRSYENILVTSESVYVSRRSPFGHQSDFQMPLGWTRVELNRLSRSDLQVSLIHKGKRLIIGSLLSPPEREELAKALETGLAKARSTPAET